MRRLRWLTLGWPGLPQLWFAGSLPGLAIAVGFAVLLNLGVLSSRLWTELFSPQIQTLIWLAVGVFWAAAVATSARRIAGLSMSGPSGDDEGLFNLARSEYLKGNWFEAEVTLDRLLTRNVLDVESRLMLAMLLRHTRARRRSEPTPCPAQPHGRHRAMAIGNQPRTRRDLQSGRASIPTTKKSPKSRAWPKRHNVATDN